jgi:DNA-binding transcriptional LysR family regulator
MDLPELEVLVAVAEEKGFSRAAERLGRTQPAVSQAIRRLEDEVGTRLVDRSSKDGTLTAAGAVLYGHAQQLLNLRRDAEAAVRDLSHLKAGKVAIAANEYTVLHLLDVLTEFRRRHPGIRIEVKRSLASEIPSEILGRDVELGVLTYRPPQPGLGIVPLATDEIVLLVNGRHRLAGRAHVAIRELGGEVFLAHNVRSPHRERVVKAFERQRTPLQIVIELPTLDAIHRLVAAGVGVALSPRRAAEADIERGDVVPIVVSDLRLPRPVNLVYRTAVELSHAAAAFVACAREGGRA